jgi:hypothetical protein
MLEGNHDERVARKTQGEVHLGMLLNQDPKVIYSRYSFMWLETSRGPVWVFHPGNYSRNPIVLGQKYYTGQPRKSHIIMGHCHRKQIGMSLDGQHEIHCIGTGRDAKRTKYKATRVKAFPEWDASFCVVNDGFIEHLDIKTTNWKKELGSLYPIYESQFKE